MARAHAAHHLIDAHGWIATGGLTLAWSHGHKLRADCTSSLGQPVPSRSTAALSHEQPLLDQSAECGFERVCARSVFTHHVARGHAALRSGVVENLHSQFGEFNGRPLAFYL